MTKSIARLSALFLFIACFAALSRVAIVRVNAEPSYNKPAASILSTFRIRAETQYGNTVVTGHGTAFGIDLSDYGMDKPRYILTACHVIRESDGQMRPVLKVEVRDNGATRWAHCKVIAYDPQMDISLLESDSDLPVCAHFAEHPTECGSPVLLVGCPTGIEPTPYDGYLTEQGGRDLSSAHVEFFKQGCSGCPVFDATSYNVIGVAVAGVRKGDGMDPHTSLFIPLEGIRQFLGANLPRYDPVQAAKRREEAVAEARHLWQNVNPIESDRLAGIRRTVQPPPTPVAIAKPVTSQTAPETAPVTQTAKSIAAVEPIQKPTSNSAAPAHKKKLVLAEAVDLKGKIHYVIRQ